LATPSRSRQQPEQPHNPIPAALRSAGKLPPAHSPFSYSVTSQSRHSSAAGSALGTVIGTVLTTAPLLSRRQRQRGLRGRHHRAGPKTFRSDWQKGSTWDLEHKDAGLVVSDPEQVILESEPYRQLSYTWHSFTPEWATEVGMDEATADSWRAEPRSKVTFDMEDVGKGVTKLTVVHDGFPPASSVLQAISQGWPAVLSSLKTLLETGPALPAA
jgi:hypothetical protein